MDTINKRYVHDHVSSYKNRGEKLGSSNRFVRAHRANEDRKALRLDEITKRRGLVLSQVNECNLSLEENSVQKKTTVKTKDKTTDKAKAKSSSKENAPQPQVTDDRKAMLLKWREQRELKRKAEAAKKPQKGVFAVRHVRHKKDNTFFTPFPTKAARTSPKKPKSASVPPAKHVTRSSARLASKQTETKPAAKGRPTSSKREVPIPKKPVTVNKVVDVPKRVTRQSVKAKTSSTNAKKVIPVENEKNKAEEKNEKENNHPAESEKKATPLAKKKQQRKSFAPPNFQFTAPSGIHSFEHYSKEFKFQPLSPASTENFFKGLAPAISTPENRQQLITKNNFGLRSEEAENENPVPMSEETGDSKTNQTSAANEKDGISRKEENNEKESKEMECENNISSKYFRDLVSSETEKLNLLCDKWEKEMESDNEIPEEAKGSIRTAIGQAQLLISQRFKQFSGLIDLSEDEAAEKKATLSDLQGFWDMIYFQVEDVHTKMDSLGKQKEKNWIIETKQVKAGGAKKTKKSITVKGAGKKDGKPAAKSRIQEMRAAMRAKMAEKKRHMQAEDGECTAFITVLTPVKKNKTSGLAGDVVLTPVRRSLRNTPISHSGTPHATPKVISTPKRFGKKSPGLRLTPEAIADDPRDTGLDESLEEKMENGQESTDEKEKATGSLSSDLEAQTSDDLSSKENNTSESTDQDMEKDQKEIFPSTKRRSCLRSSTKKKRKSSRVFFQSPQPSANSTAGGTPGSLVFTPRVQGNVWSTGITLTPVAVSFDSLVAEGNTCSINAGHTPAPASDRRRSLRKRASNGTPVRRSSRNNPSTTPVERDSLSSDSAPEMSTSPEERHVGTASCVDKETTRSSGSKRRSLRRSCRKSAANEGDSFLPSKYFLPSSSSEEDGDDTAPAASPVLAGKHLRSNSQSLVTFTPVKDSSNRINQSSLTPSTMFMALSLDDSGSGRRDSVFFAPSGSLMDNSQPAKENLICFSPVLE